MTRPAPDTIAAIATPAGIGGVGIVRLSGPRVPDIARAVLGALPPPRHALLASFLGADGTPIDQGLALYFPEPHSFTGEHVLELHGHGGPVVLDLLIQRLLAAGARVARPGEFSERAFLNGKLDLAQAEAVADLIESASASAARAALHSLQGAFSARVRGLREQLIAMRVQIEAALDFPEEELELIADPTLVERARTIAADVAALAAASRQGQLLRDGMTIALTGRPNAGKSSLLNLLAQRDAAIVSAVPGTTRDVLREAIQIDGLPLHVLDTAGLRDTRDEIETEGVRRARRAMQDADRVLLVIDDSQEREESIRALLADVPQNTHVTLVRNKIDLSGRATGHVDVGPLGVAEVALSALDGRGLEALHEHLKRCAGFRPAEEGAFSARRRHLEALTRCGAHLAAVPSQLAAGRGELAAEELRQAQQALAEITGEFTSDELLGRIFASFCIGK
jgi:tRNA modification GTPase